MIVLRKPCSGSSPATYPTYSPFIGAFPVAGRNATAPSSAADHPRVRGAPATWHSPRRYLDRGLLSASDTAPRPAACGRSTGGSAASKLPGTLWRGRTGLTQVPPVARAGTGG